LRASEISVAVRLAGSSDFNDATAGKPCCYRRFKQGSNSGFILKRNDPVVFFRLLVFAINAYIAS
jgi:hypothetical protein